MIEITVTKKRIDIAGHANYSEYGKDIVCASISVLFQTFVESIERVTRDEADIFISPGMSYIEYEHLSEQGIVLLDAFLLGCEMVASTYPDYVRIV